MKRFIIAFICTFVATAAWAQNSGTVNATATPQPTVEQVVSTPKTDWLKAFDNIKIDGPMNVVLKKVATAAEARIFYDTKGNITSKFKFEINRKGTLVVSEKSELKRTTVTDVVIYYTSLREVKVSHAKVEISDKIERDLFDLSVSGGATVNLDIKVLDAEVECTGSSRLTMSGSSKYLTMRASTAKIDCSGLSTVSSTIEASNSAEVRVTVSERLDAKASTGAKLLYKGRPVILRDHNAVFGGDIINIY